MPGAVATVRLEVGYKRSPRYNVLAPKLEVVGWSGGAANSNQPELARPVLVDMDDDIPF